MSTSPGPSWRYTTDALSEKFIKHAERTLEVDFPADYRACVRENHGGAPEPDEFAFDLNGARVISRVGLLLTLDIREAENVVGTTQALVSQKRLPEGLIAIIDDSSGNFICLDYRNDPGRKAPTIAYASTDGAIAPVAGGFSEFLGMLGAGASPSR